MKAISFLVQTVANPNTGEESQRLAVRFDNGEVIRMYIGERSLDEVVAEIKADKASFIAKVVPKNGQFGRFCVFSHAVTNEEF